MGRERQNEEVNSVQPSEKKNSILVIEDDPAQLRLMRRSLDSAFHVKLAEGALEAFSILESEPVDLIVSDIDLPGLTGLELCRRVKADANLRNIPIIFVSAMGTSEDRFKGLNIGADAYLSKPFRVDELIERIRETLKRAASLKAES